MKAIILFFITINLFSAEFSANRGGVFIAKAKNIKQNEFSFENKSFFWNAHPNNKNESILILPIPYHTKARKINITNDIILHIFEKNYKKENINIIDKSTLKPNKKNQIRIDKERSESLKIYANPSKTRFWNLPFVMPLNSEITSLYGNARIFNNEIKSYHRGIDLKASIGTEIHAINHGKVVISKHRFLSGGSVVIDHGDGIFSVYYHLSEQKVKVGDIIKKGDLIALSGASGRVSGPHLHFAILINGIAIDPIDFMEKMNALIDVKL